MTLDGRAARSLGGNSTEHELLAPATGAAEEEEVGDELHEVQPDFLLMLTFLAALVLCAPVMSSDSSRRPKY